MSRSNATCLVLAVGIMGNVMYNLAKLKWVPISYDLWQDPHGDRWQLNAAFSPDALAQNLQNSFELILWAKAAGHHNGGGAQLSITYEYTVAQLNRLKKAKQYRESASLETIC